MGKGSHKQNNMGSSSLVNPPHFFKIVTYSNVEHNKLRIPTKFIEEYGNNFRDFVLLNVPSGAIWRVELITKNGEVWLCNGLKKFIDYFSIRPGHLLVFKYKGDANFNVIIFDKSASEIDYPCSVDLNGKNNENSSSKGDVKEETAEDESVQIVEDIHVNDNPKPTRIIKKEQCKGTSMIASESGALQSAKAFKSKQPFFMISMGRSYVSAKATLKAPRAFARQHLSKGRTKITLQVSSGRSWTGTCVYASQPPECRFYWPSFARDNGLKIGDVCVFEMINRVKVCFHLHIFRAT